MLNFRPSCIIYHDQLCFDIFLLAPLIDFVNFIGLFLHWITLIVEISVHVIIIAVIHLIGVKCGIWKTPYLATVTWQATVIILTSFSYLCCVSSVNEWFSIYYFYRNWYKWVVCSADFRTLSIEYPWSWYCKS